MHIPILSALLAIAFAGMVVPSDATTPANGKVSKAAPKITWSGETTSGGVAFQQFDSNPEGATCQAPTCDTFTLEVLDGGFDLAISVNLSADGTGGDGTAGMRITDPSGKKTWYTGDSSPSTTWKTTLKAVPAGKFVFDHMDSFICCGTTGFTAKAELLVGGAAPAPAPGPAAPAPGPSAETKLTIKAGRYSARKLSRSKKLAATLSTSAPLSNVRLLLVKGRKTVAQTRVSTLSGTKKVTLRLKKKLKAGTYRLSAGGTDANGRNVVASLKIRIAR